MPETPPDQPGGTTSQPGLQLALIGGLLVLIIALLSFLWMRERSRRFEAEIQLAELSQSMSHDPVAQFMRKMSIRKMPAQVQGVRREDLPIRIVDLDERSRRLFRVSAAAGERMGFLPGDVIEVAGPADADSDAPASLPSDD